VGLAHGARCQRQFDALGGPFDHCRLRAHDLGVVDVGRIDRLAGRGEERVAGVERSHRSPVAAGIE
jgi:hypothetical protein